MNPQPARDIVRRPGSPFLRYVGGAALQATDEPSTPPRSWLTPRLRWYWRRSCEIDTSCKPQRPAGAGAPSITQAACSRGGLIFCMGRTIAARTNKDRAPLASATDDRLTDKYKAEFWCAFRSPTFALESLDCCRHGGREIAASLELLTVNHAPLQIPPIT